ncbi:TPA: hypothetical protein ACH9L8_005493, partial [Escherichia coli]
MQCKCVAVAGILTRSLSSQGEKWRMKYDGDGRASARFFSDK